MTEKKVTQAPANVYQRIAAVMHELRGVEKSSTNSHFKFKYAGHSAVNEAVRPLFLQHGITQTVSAHGFNVMPNGTVYCVVRVRWACTDNPDSFVEGDVPSAMPGAKGECTPQQCGSMLSYGTKNFTFKALMLTDSNEPDADSYTPDRPDEYADWNGNAARPASRDEASDLALGYLARFNECHSKADVEKLKAEIRGNWQAVRGVPDFGEAVVVQSKKALARVSQPRMRQPGEDD